MRITGEAIVVELFRFVARHRRARALHPKGEAFEGTITLYETALGGFGPEDALVRFSRAIGLPSPLPDFLGVAVKFRTAEGIEQDLLFTSSGRRRLSRYILRPRRSTVGWYSSVLPYAHDGRLVLFGAKISDSTRLPEIRIFRAHILGGWQLVAAVSLERQMNGVTSRDLRFSPWNTSEKFRPAGFVNRLRAGAYAGSQQGRGAM